MSVDKSNIAEQQAPETVDALVNFVEYVRQHPKELFVQISGNSEEIVKAVANHFDVNYFEMEDMKVDLNPFAIFYITSDNEIVKRAQTFKSKIILYARRPIHHHHH